MSIRPDPRALLHHLLSDRLSQRFVQKMRRRVMACDLAPTVRVDGNSGFLTGAHLTRNDSAQVRDHAIAKFLGVLDADPAAWGRDGSCVADLPA